MAEEQKSDSAIITRLRKQRLNDLTKEFVTKSVEHQLKKDLVEFVNESNRQKEKVLAEEKQNLEKLCDEMYKLENDFCESVWKFSREHDFGNFLSNYPRVKKPPACNCEFYKENCKTIEKELEENAEIRKVTREVEALKLELETLSNDKNLEDEMKKASEELKFASEEDEEIQRLTKVLQNSQQELEFLQSEIEHFKKKDISLKNLEKDLDSTRKKKKLTREEKPSKLIQKTPRVNKNPNFDYPNTIDNYLILQGNKVTPTEDKKSDESRITTEAINQDNYEILNSWDGINPDDESFFAEIENSIKDTYTFLESSSKLSVKETVFETPMKPQSEDFKESEAFTWTESTKKNSLTVEQKSILTTFTPKKKSAISEKLLKKY